jgi:hypothetical protein
MWHCERECGDYEHLVEKSIEISRTKHFTSSALNRSRGRELCTSQLKVLRLRLLISELVGFSATFPGTKKMWKYYFFEIENFGRKLFEMI